MVHKISDQGVFALFSNSSLINLDIQGCSKVTDCSIIMIAEQFSMLAVLNMKNCKSISEIAINAICIGCSQLSKLILDGCEKCNR